MATLKAFLHGKEFASIHLRTGEEYVIGRADGCAIQLEEQPGISRQHVKISEHEGVWKASVLSKFGEIIVSGEAVSELELNQTSVFNVASYDFRLVDEASAVSTAIHTSRSAAVSGENFSEDAPQSPPPNPGGTLSLVPAQVHQQATAFEGNDDATNVGISRPGRPAIRIVKSNGSEQRIDLDGKKWLAGREDTCDIFLPDRKASRRQFEITSTPEGYFVTDLGSANGTVLNGTPLVPEEPHLLQSGDVISINALKVHFEVRDPNFEKRLVTISPNVLAAPLVPVAQYEMINYPVLQGPGGAVRIDSYGAEWAANNDKKNSKTKTIRLAAILAIVIVGLYAAFGTESDEKKGKPSDPGSGIARLSAQQKQVVKEIYVTARNLYMQGKFENAYEQLKKLHEILPEGYEGSKTMEEDCLAQRANAEKLAFIEAEQKRVEEQKRIIDRNIQQCNPIANRTFSVDEIRQCLSPTIGLDPTNPLVIDLIGRVEKRVSERTSKLSAHRDYQDKVDRGRELHEKALALQRQGQWYPAIDAFNKHVASPLPDPDGLKSRSQQNVVKIKSMLAAKVDEALAAANSAYQSRNFKVALEGAKRAKEFDPKSEKAAEFIARVRKELNSQLRTLYEDAILYEGVGQVKEAQSKWRQIMDRDTSDGEYYLKSKMKLRNYSDQGS